MPTEFEAKILDIEPRRTADKILACGGRRLGDALMRRYVYDIVPGDASRWIRLRDTGSAVTLTIKEIATDAIDGTHEVEVTVDDFNAADELLGKLGFRPKAYQENRRSSFALDGARLEIDTWPRIPPYLEIEADSREEVVRIATLLGYAAEHLVGENTIKVYARHGIDLGAIGDLRFEETG